MIQGSTLFLGDSITVGLAGLVPVAGEKGSLAEGGKTSGWLLPKVKALPDLTSYRNAFLLIGTNDIGGDTPWETTVHNIQEMRDVLTKAGVRAFVATIPPFKGYAGYEARFATIDDKRRRINDALLRLAPPQVVDLDHLMADPSDPLRLRADLDGGDHLHPNKAGLAKIVDAAMSGAQPTSSTRKGPDLLALSLLALGMGAGYALSRGYGLGTLTRKAFG